MQKHSRNNPIMKKKTPKVRRSTVWGSRTTLLLCLLLATATYAFAASGSSGSGSTSSGTGSGPKLSQDLAAMDPASQVDVIVQYSKAPGSTNVTKVKNLGGSLKKGLTRIKANTYSVRRDKLERLLSDDSMITYISPDRPVQGSLDYAIPTVGADIAGIMFAADGTGVGVAVIDSGITPSNDLRNPATGKSRIVYNQSFVPNDTGTNDVYEHGSHIAGIIGGNGSGSACSNCSVTFKGMAPGVNIINLRALDAYGRGTDAAVIAAIQRAIELKSTYNIRVLNLSLGRGIFESYTTDPLCKAVEDAWKAGIVVVAAAGNYGRDNSSGNQGYGTITAPGNDPYVITVGAMNTMMTKERADDVITSYSSKGPSLLDHVVKPDIVAPGNRIISLLSYSSTTSNLYPDNTIAVSYYKDVGSTTESGVYYRLSGTSMATPMVSGAVALMLQRNPLLTPDQVKARLMKTASKTFPLYSSWTDPVTGMTYNSQYDIFTVGAGYLDVAAAMASTDLAPTTVGVARSPSVAYNSSTGEVYLVSDSSVLWGSSVMWGTSVVWGTSVLWGTNTSGQSVLWGSSVCWGSSTSQGFSVIWGSSVMWGASQSSADAMPMGVKGGY
jgi:serine protease AprX